MIKTASSKIIGCIMASGVLFAGCGAESSHVSEQSLESSSNVQDTEVCFTVQNPGDSHDSQVSGTLFHTEYYTSTSTALLLLHGMVAERSVWNGGGSELPGLPPMATLLAKEGYGVVAIDRLGHAESPYDGSGFALTSDGAVERAHQMVQQIRSGDFEVSSGTCNDREPNTDLPGAANIVVMGASYGGILVSSYATRYDDIDGVVQMAVSNQGISLRFDRQIQEFILPQIEQDQDYVNFFATDEDGFSHDCEELMMYPPGTTPAHLERICGQEYYGNLEERTTPSGELASAEDMMAQTREEIGNVGPTPALLVFPDRDAFFPPPDSGFEPDVVTPEIEMWESSCNCDVSVVFQEDAGHANWFHKSARDVVDDVTDWLVSRGL